jgi:hypothetical protein
MWAFESGATDGRRQGLGESISLAAVDPVTSGKMVFTFIWGYYGSNIPTRLVIPFILDLLLQSSW